MVCWFIQNPQLLRIVRFHLCVCVFICVQGFLQLLFTLLVEKGSHKTWSLLLWLEQLPSESQESYFCFLSTVTGLTFVLLPVFYVGAGDPNSSPHVCVASALLTEPSPQFCGWLSSWAVEIKLKSLFFPVLILFETLSHWARRRASVIRLLEWQRM